MGVQGIQGRKEMKVNVGNRVYVEEMEGLYEIEEYRKWSKWRK